LLLEQSNARAQERKATEFIMVASSNPPYWRKQLAPQKLFFFLLFHGIHVAIFVIGWSAASPPAPTNTNSRRWKQVSNTDLVTLNDLNFSVWISRGAGLVLSIDCSLVVLPMCRSLMTWIRPKLRSLPLDETQYFHRQVAYSILFWTIVHVTAHYVK